MKIDEKYFSNNGTQLNTIDDALNEGEKVLWRDKPNRHSYIWSAVLKMLPVAVLWMAIDAAFLVFISIGMKNGSMPLKLLYFIVPFFILHLTPVWIWLANIVKSAAQMRNMEYAITDKRIILRSGIIGIDFKFINYTEIDSVNVKVGIVDKIFKVGDIYVNSSVNSGVLFDVKNPYVLGNQLQKVVLDIKTDSHFPNALRPDENPGYKTTYTANPFDKLKK